MYYEIKLSDAHITGGEPTLYPHLAELIGALKHIGFEVKTTTNGQFNSGLLKEFCMGIGIEWRILTNWNQEESSIQWIETFLQSIGVVRDRANLIKTVTGFSAKHDV